MGQRIPRSFKLALLVAQRISCSFKLAPFAFRPIVSAPDLAFLPRKVVMGPLKPLYLAQRALHAPA